MGSVITDCAQLVCCSTPYSGGRIFLTTATEQIWCWWCSQPDYRQMRLSSGQVQMPCL